MIYRSRAVSSIFRTIVENVPCALAATTPAAETTAKSFDGTASRNQGSNSLSWCAISRIPNYVRCQLSIAYSMRAVRRGRPA